MSRIEKALEKAAHIRKKDRQAVQPEQGDNETAIPRSVFELQEPIIDPAAVNKHIVCLTDPFSTAAEQYKKIRARICAASEKDFLNSILITSARSNEGKTITAINLAIAMAQEIDYTVLLIDADLRKPSIHTYLGIKPKYGLSDYLLSKCPLSDALVKTGIGKLVLLPAGTPPTNPSELLASEKMRDLVREMKYRYRDRYIIFDSTPILTAADSMYLKEYIDGVMFVVQAARTTEQSAKEALALLKGTRVFGTVLNSVPEYLSSWHGNSKLEGLGDRFDAAGTMEKLERFIAALRNTDLRGIAAKIKIGLNGMAKWKKKS